MAEGSRILLPAVMAVTMVSVEDPAGGVRSLPLREPVTVTADHAWIAVTFHEDGTASAQGMRADELPEG